MKKVKPKARSKRFGIVSFHEGELSSRPDSLGTMSFSYFRTRSGRPPSVEQAEQEAAANKPPEPRKAP